MVFLPLMLSQFPAGSIQTQHLRTFFLNILWILDHPKVLLVTKRKPVAQVYEPVLVNLEAVKEEVLSLNERVDEGNLRL